MRQWTVLTEGQCSGCGDRAFENTCNVVTDQGWRGNGGVWAVRTARGMVIVSKQFT